MVAVKKTINCCDTTAKILLVIFNCLFWAFGIAILGVGIWLKTDPNFANLGQAIKVGGTEPVLEIVTWIFIGAGIFVFAVGVVGMIGIARESKIMMGFYLVCVFLVFIAEAGGGVYVGVRKDYIIEQIEKEGSKFIKEFYTIDPNNNNYAVSNGFNYVQVLHECCGVKDFMDYHNSSYLKELGNQIRPNASMSWACCHTTSDLDEAFRGTGELTVDADSRDICMAESIHVTGIYQATVTSNGELSAEVQMACDQYDQFRCKGGCVSELVQWTEDNMIVLIAVAASVGGVQLILMLLALWFCQALGSDDK